MSVTEAGIGLELIQFNAALILAEQINDELEVQQERWTNRDFEWATATGQDASKVELEWIDPTNIWKGHRPITIEQNVDQRIFPNISVMAYVSNPASLNDIVDQMSNTSPMLDIEVGIKGETEQIVDPRTHRTVEAVHQVLARNESLNGVSLGWDNDPVVRITDIYKRKSEGSYGEDWFFQLARMRYTLTRHTRIWNIDQ